MRKKTLCRLSVGESGAITKIEHPTSSCAIFTMCCGVGERLTLRRKIGGDLFCVKIEGGSSFCIRKKDATFIKVEAT